MVHRVPSRSTRKTPKRLDCRFVQRSKPGVPVKPTRPEVPRPARQSKLLRLIPHCGTQSRSGRISVGSALRSRYEMKSGSRTSRPRKRGTRSGSPAGLLAGSGCTPALPSRQNSTESSQEYDEAHRRRLIQQANGSRFPEASPYRWAVDSKSAPLGKDTRP